MSIRGIVFDINGTLIDIRTEESHDEIYRVLSNLLSYQGVLLSPADVKEQYFKILGEQRGFNNEHHPEFDAVHVFREIIWRNATDFTRRLPREKLDQLPLIMAETFRAASRFRLDLYPGVREVLSDLRHGYRLGVLSDGQYAYAVNELNVVGLLDYFDPIIISGNYGYRKPDRRLYEAALSHMNLAPWETLFVGDNMYRDIYGAKRMGMKTVYFKTGEWGRPKHGIEPDYIIYNFAELHNALGFFN
jgi:putative hydrolase of the HAD superfamily